MTTSTSEPSAGDRHTARAGTRRTPPAAAPPARRDTRRPGPQGPGTRGPGQTRRRTGGAHAPDTLSQHGQPHWWFAQRLLEVLSGQRPAGWMLGHTRGESVYDRLWHLASQGVLRPSKGRPTPRVRACGYRAPAPGVIEAFARIASGDALRALAFRLERGADRRWRCTAVDTAGPPW